MSSKTEAKRLDMSMGSVPRVGELHTTAGLVALTELVHASARIVALTGAGCSTGSGIPDYRDDAGEWKRKPPLRFQQFVDSIDARKRYWARSMVGWRLVEGAQPNAAHEALARIEAAGRLHYLVTQNVDGLHQKAGSERVNDLHGRVDRVCCLGCATRLTRAEFQERLLAMNPGWHARAEGYAPDGDADLARADFESFRVPECPRCSGVLKPDVVFFGESVPRPRVDEAMVAIDAADLLLVVGSSLMVWSGYRFVKRAVEKGVAVAAVNLGKTRADAEIGVKVRADCGEVLQALVGSLSA